MTIIKRDIIDVIHKRVELPKYKTSTIVESLLEIIKTTLAGGENITVSGFGKFCIKEKKSRKNTILGSDFLGTEDRWVTFCCSNVLRKKLNNGEDKDEEH